MSISIQFPILKNCTYLNTAASGLLSTELAKWRSTHDEQFLNGAAAFRLGTVPLFSELRNNLAQFAGTRAENTFFSNNFSTGFIRLLDGLGPDHRYLLLEEDYPSISYLVICRNVPYEMVAINERMEENIIRAIEQFKPTVFAFSLVQYITGIRMQQDFIHQLKSRFPNLILIADGTQFLGTAAFHFDTSGMDALLGSGYKWLLGGYGNGYMLLSDRLKDRLSEHLQHIEIPAKFLNGNTSALSLFLEPGHLDSLNFGSLNEGIKLLRDIGISTIEEHNQTLAEQARIALYDLGLLPDWIVQRPEQSCLMTIPLSLPFVQKLEADRIHVAARGHGSRISMHFYNTEEDLQRFLSVVA